MPTKKLTAREVLAIAGYGHGREEWFAQSMFFRRIELEWAELFARRLRRLGFAVVAVKKGKKRG